MSVIANIAMSVFSLLIAAAAFGYFRDRGDTVAEAGAYGLMVMLMLSSWTAQILLLLGLQRFLLVAMLILTVPALKMVILRGKLLREQLRISSKFMRLHTLPAIVFVCGGTCLFAFTVWNEIARGAVTFKDLYPALAHLDGSFFALLQTSSVNAATGLNHVIFLADWQPMVAPPLANSAAYLVIALGTYALARRYAWPPTAITATLLIVSMPRLVHQNLAAQSELLPAASALLVILALFRMVEQPHREDGIMLLAAACFSVTDGRLCYLLPAVLLLLSILVLARRHNLRLWFQSLKGHWGYLATALAVVLIFSQVIAISYNLRHGLPWMGALPGKEVAFNAGGIVGAVANMARYLLQSIHLPDFMDTAAQRIFGWGLVDALDHLYRQAVATWAGERGAAEAYRLTWAPDNAWTWFGPVGFLMVIPALLQALWWGPHRLKTTALAMFVYWMLVALIVAWRLDNVRLLTPMFVCSGFFTAFFLPPWRIGRTGCRVLQWFSLAMTVYALLTYPGHNVL
jgi:hypothetical protein